jgi:hypothetical protein
MMRNLAAWIFIVTMIIALFKFGFTIYTDDDAVNEPPCDGKCNNGFRCSTGFAAD